MYSLVPFAPGVRNVRIKPTFRLTPEYMSNGQLFADHCGDTWFVCNRVTGLVEAIFHAEPNVHGWSASQAHARSYLIRANPIDIAALDSIT
jgi:hypothetical protein